MAKSCCKNPSAVLNKRVTIQNASQVSDSQGGFTETWADGDEVWASIEPLKGFERFQAMQMQSPVTHKVVMRHRTDVTAASRLKFISGATTRIFWVKEVLNPKEENRFLEIKAMERS